MIGGNPVDETALLFGAWGVDKDGGIAPSGGSLQGRALTKVHTVVARVRADAARAAGLLKAANLAALKPALGGG